MTQHVPISGYGIIGNGQSASLVGQNGSIDWCCWPRFDSPAVFCRILDLEQGGFFRVAPTGSSSVERRYMENTNILVTTFTTDSGVVRLTDLMPAPVKNEGDVTIPHRILRHIECLSGTAQWKIELQPTFQFAQAKAQLEIAEKGGIASTAGETLTLLSPIGLEVKGKALVAEKTVTAGEKHWLVLTHGRPASATQTLELPIKEIEAEYDRTLKYWRKWAEKCQYEGPYRELVIRSALVLKLLVFQPTGGLIAAPTTSLPAEIGGVRNWDYRYTWLRDAGLVLDALQQLGYHEESVHFIEWLERLGVSSNHQLKVMYTVEGRPAPEEQTLDHLAGYRDSQPVRVGNGAVSQSQIDTYGHVIDAVTLCFDRMPRDLKPELWEFLRSMADQAASQWDQPDQGPWEMRGAAKHYLYSKLFCWVGLDRALRFAEKHGLEGDLEKWKQQREAIREAILSRGYQAEVGAFTQTFGSADLDASSLSIPIAGLLPIDDPRVQSTLSRVREELTKNGLVYRYKLDDGLPGSDATFTLCSFWLVMNLTLAGHVAEARDHFERICNCANDVGLLAEQIEPDSGEMRGNFPQGFAHLGLIRAALYLQEAQEQAEAS